MGNSKSKSGVTAIRGQIGKKLAFEICAVTGDVKNAADTPKDSVIVRLVLHDETSGNTPPISLENLIRPDLVAGSQDKFPLAYSDWTKAFGRLASIEVWLEDVEVSDANAAFGYAPRQQNSDPTKVVQWYCEKIVVRDRRKGAASWEYFYFPMQRWLYPGKHYFVQHLNVALPQFDVLNQIPSSNPAPDGTGAGSEREQEISENRRMYMYEQKAPGLPVQAKFIPMEEEFSERVQFDLNGKRTKLIDDKSLLEVYPPSAAMASLSDLLKMYYFKALPAPQGMGTWMIKDPAFGSQRLRGCNPCVLRAIDKIPDNFGVTADMIRANLDGWTLQHALQSRRVFLVDYAIMDGLAGAGRPMVAPMALFFLTSDKQLVPLAIQLQQRLGEQNLVFVPTDPPNVWFQAKQWFNVADACYQQLVLHFAYTHLVAESVYLALRRTLSSSHPVFQLLMPHLNHICIVNALSVNQLLFPQGSWVDRNVQLGRDASLQLMARAMRVFRLNVHGSPLQELKSRGVLDENIVPVYPYRDDAVLLYKLLDAYVDRNLRIFYDSTDKLASDYEIQQFRTELVTPSEHGGAGLSGVPGDEISGQWTGIEQLTETLSAILFLVTVQHAAVCNSQYDELGFPPNYSSLLNGVPPVELMDKQLSEVGAAQVDRRRAADLVLTSYLFGERFPSGAKLGHLRSIYLHLPQALAALEDLKAKLADASKQIRERNAQRQTFFKYQYLDPEFIHNFITV